MIKKIKICFAILGCFLLTGCSGGVASIEEIREDFENSISFETGSKEIDVNANEKNRKEIYLMSKRISYRTDLNRETYVYCITEWEYDLHGNVVREKSSYYSADNGISPDHILDFKYEYTYDERERLAKKNFINADGSISSWVEYEYDEAGNLSNEFQYYSGEEGVVKTRYIYDQNNRLIEYVMDSPTSGDWHKYEYDANGNQITFINYALNGDTENYVEKIYDNNGRCISEIDHNYSFIIGNIEFVTTHQYEYDENDNVIKKITSTSTGSYYGWIQYEYDENGNMLKAVEYEENGKMTGSWTEYEYKKEKVIISN